MRNIKIEVSRSLGESHILLLLKWFKSIYLQEKRI